MDFTTFSRLYSGAASAANLEAYLAEHSQLDVSADTLTAVYSMAKGGIAAIVEASGMSKAAFRRAFKMSERGLFWWLSGDRTPPPYVPLLLAYAVLNLTCR